MVHVHMLCIYIGKSALPLLQCFGEHGTTADACVKDSSFHDMLRTIGLAEWTPILLQFTSDEIQACFLERNWWYRLQRWAQNDCARAVLGDTSPTKKPVLQHSKRLYTRTRQLLTATQDRGFAHRHAVNHELTTLATSMQIPLIHITAVCVPYLSPTQTPATTRAINKIVHQIRSILHSDKQCVQALSLHALSL